jgi:hypothetical protein
VEWKSILIAGKEKVALSVKQDLNRESSFFDIVVSIWYGSPPPIP